MRTDTRVVSAAPLGSALDSVYTWFRYTRSVPSPTLASGPVITGMSRTVSGSSTPGARHSSPSSSR
jgi:hypothetical protein